MELVAPGVCTEITGAHEPSRRHVLEVQDEAVGPVGLDEATQGEK